MERQDRVIQNRHRRAHRWKRVIGVLSGIVVSVTTYALILPALTENVQTWCGMEEHTHGDSCYEQRLVCGLREGEETTVELDPGHRHSEACYQADGTLICGQEEREPVLEKLPPHVHSETCYQRVLCCTEPEHRHEELCYSNVNQVETPEQWELQLPLDQRDGVWADDLLLIAESQLGFRESEENFALIDGQRRGYTRFGDWYGQRYGDWSATFVSFCLHYADIPASFVPYESDPARWAEALQEQGLYRARGSEEAEQSEADYLPQKGDLVFFASEDDANAAPSRVGIVKELTGQGEEISLVTVEGDAEGKVESRTYELRSAAIAGFAQLPERPEWLEAFQSTDAPTEGTEPGDPKETGETDVSLGNSANVLRGAYRNSLSFRGENYEIVVRWPDGAPIPADAELAVRELAPDGLLDRACEAIAAALPDSAREPAYSRFFEIKLLDAAGAEIPLTGESGAGVEIRLLDPRIPETCDHMSVVRFTEEGAILTELERTVLREDSAAVSVLFRAEETPAWGVVCAKTFCDRQLSAEGEGVKVLLDVPGRARIAEEATLELVELMPGTEEYEACYAEALRLLSEEKGEPASICFARFFDLTIRGENGEVLEPDDTVNVSFDYDRQFQLSLGQQMYVVHFAEDGAELIETDLSRAVDENGEEAEGTCIAFRQNSFSITGTVLTDDELINDNSSIYYGFPKMAASYYVSFDADANGDGVDETYAMGYGGVVEQVTRNADGTITFSGIACSDKTVSDQWFNSFNWYYNNEADLNNIYFRQTQTGTYSDNSEGSSADYYGNFLSNDCPFEEEPARGYLGGTEDLSYSTTAQYYFYYNGYYYGYNDYRNRLRSSSSSSDWDYQNYSYTISGSSVSNVKAKHGPMGGLCTFIVREKYSDSSLSGTPTETYVLPLDQIELSQTDYQNINRPARSLYIDSEGNIRLAMQATVKSSYSVKKMYPVQAERTTMGAVQVPSNSGVYYIVCDAILVLDNGYWKWVFPYEMGKGKPFPNAVKARNLKFSTGYTTDGLLPAQPSTPLNDALESYRLNAPEISKTLMPNNGGDGTYSLSLSVMGDSHASFKKVMADVLIVADMSNSMTQTDGGTKMRLDILKDALGILSHSLLGQNTEEKMSVALNMMTFGSNAADYDGYDGKTRPWVTSQSDFQNYINSLPVPSGNKELCGATNWEDALEQAYNMLKNRRTATENDSVKHVQYLIFLTDGEPTAYMLPRENVFPGGYDWAWDSDPYSTDGFFGTGSTQPMNIYYSLLEARDDARRIVWGIDKNNGNTSGIQDAENNTHINPETGEMEPVTTYMYAIATMGNADTLTNLLAYAYNGSLEATYPEGTFMMADDEAGLNNAFRTIANSIYGTMAAYTNISIYDPCTEFTHVAADLDNDPNSVFHYYRYRCDVDFNIWNDDGDAMLFRAHKNANGVVDYYEDCANENARVDNIYERLEEWNRQITVQDYSGGTATAVPRELGDASFNVQIYLTEDDTPVDISELGGDYTQVGSDPSQGLPYYYKQWIAWDMVTTAAYTDAQGNSTNRFLLEKGYTYSVVVTVWPYQALYDAIAGLNNGQITWEDLSDDILTKYIHYNESTGEYYYDTNLWDEEGNSEATVSYGHYEEYTDPDSGETTITITDTTTQVYVNPEAIPLAEYKIHMKKTWVDSLDETLLEKLIENAVSAKLQELTGQSLAQYTTAEILALSPETLTKLRKAYSAQLVLLSKPIDAEFPSTDANVFGTDVEGEWVYYTGDIGACSMFFQPGWHFYGEQAGENDPNHLGRIVVDQRFTEQQEINVSAGTLVSEANFNPLNNSYGLSKMRLFNPDGSRFDEKDYFIIEEGYDYTLREVNSDGSFSLSTEYYHPMLIDGTVYDVTITEHVENGGDGVPYYYATVKSDSGLSTLEAVNTLRPQLTLGKETVRKTQSDGLETLYETDLSGTVQTQTVTVLGKTTTYQLHPMDPFTVRVEITLDPDERQILAVPDGEGYEPVSGLFYLVYPAYLDQLVAEGKLTEDDLDRYLTYVLCAGESYSIGGQSYTAGPESFEVWEAEPYPVSSDPNRKFCTVIGADITINANQHVRVYNVPDGVQVGVYEINNPLAWELLIADWENPTGTDPLHELFGSAAAQTKLSLTGNRSDLTEYSSSGHTGYGFTHLIPLPNQGYGATLYNLLLPLDLELKKISATTESRDTLALSAETTPAGTGTMYDDSKIPGLRNAQFVLYRRMEPEMSAYQMEANGLLWLKPDGSTVNGEKPEGAVQVYPAKNYFGSNVAEGATASNGRLRFQALLPGTYYLVETVPPDGFYLADPAPGSVRYLTVNIRANGVSYVQPDVSGGGSQEGLIRVETGGTEPQPVFEMLVSNSSGVELPQTGGSGHEPLSILGLSLILFGALALLIRKKRRKEACLES